MGDSSPRSRWATLLAAGSARFASQANPNERVGKYLSDVVTGAFRGKAAGAGSQQIFVWRPRVPPLSRGELAMRFSKWVLALVLVVTGVGQVALCQVVEPDFELGVAVPDPGKSPPPFRVIEDLLQEPLARLELAIVMAPEELDEIREWNSGRNLPMRNGFARELQKPVWVPLDTNPAVTTPGQRRVSRHVGGAVTSTPDGGIVWGAEVRVEGAFRLRLHLANVDLPPGTEFWVYNSDESVGPVSVDSVVESGELWTPSVAGPEIRFELLIPPLGLTSTSGFAFDRVMELFQLDTNGSPIADQTHQPEGTACLIDAQCVGPGDFNAIEGVQRAISLLGYIKNNASYICTGGLLNDTAPETLIPYLLTANHCLSTQAHVNTLEAYWDYYANGCQGSWPSLGSRPRSVGGTLLATGTGSDFTLVRLISIPSNRGLLGWAANASAAGPGTDLYRVSHPSGYPQAYSESLTYSPASSCTGHPTSRYLYQVPWVGGTFGGSSGAPVVKSGGIAVGQLWGQCGPNPSDGCDYRNDQIDGRFSTSYPSVSFFLNPPLFRLTVTKGGQGSGTVSSSPVGINCGATCSLEFAATTVVTLSATPATGSTFGGWSGHSDCSDGRITTNSNKTCTATFNLVPIPTYTLTVSKSGLGSGTVTSQPSGINCGSDCVETYDAGTSVTLTAIPNVHSQFSGWGGAADCSDGSVVMNSNLGCSAAFVPRDSLFADGFESGDTSAWTAAVP